jgi:hypothetical protein
LLALFISLGGTGYAASRIDLGASAAKSHKPAPITAKQVNKLIASYVSSHHIGAKGPEGKQGAPGASGGQGGQGVKGDPGPGAKRIALDLSSAFPGEKVSFGPWTLLVTCAASETHISVEGPEYKYAETESLSAGKPGEPGEILNFSEERGVETGIASNQQELVSAYIYSATAMEHLEVELVDVKEKGALFNSCKVLGSATPAA